MVVLVQHNVDETGFVKRPLVWQGVQCFLSCCPKPGPARRWSPHWGERGRCRRPGCSPGGSDCHSQLEPFPPVLGTTPRRNGITTRTIGIWQRISTPNKQGWSILWGRTVGLTAKNQPEKKLSLVVPGAPDNGLGSVMEARETSIRHCH